MGYNFVAGSTLGRAEKQGEEQKKKKWLHFE